jgi:hypothetical protein
MLENISLVISFDENADLMKEISEDEIQREIWSLAPDNAMRLNEC